MCQGEIFASDELRAQIIWTEVKAKIFVNPISKSLFFIDELN